jgi:pimeloyl-ACP methyl ester carboxylesterase
MRTLAITTRLLTTVLARGVLASLPLMIAVSLATGCAGEEGASTASTGPAPDTAASSPRGEASIEGSFDVGGHELFLSCTGEGEPTVIYLHGYIQHSEGSRMNSGEIPDLLSDDVRVCIYDRANVGDSESVAGRQTGADSVRDLHALLEAADVPGPYVLLGASFGGLISYMYAATYPDEVVGMVLLDASLPDDIEIDERFTPKEELQAFCEEWKTTTERIASCATYREAQALAGKALPIPVTYLAVKELDLPPSLPVKKMTAEIRRGQRDFVSRFSPGRLVFVDVAHYMEPVIPERITQEVVRVLRASRENSRTES